MVERQDSDDGFHDCADDVSQSKYTLTWLFQLLPIHLYWPFLSFAPFFMCSPNQWHGRAAQRRGGYPSDRQRHRRKQKLWYECSTRIHFTGRAIRSLLVCRSSPLDWGRVSPSQISQRRCPPTTSSHRQSRFDCRTYSQRRGLPGMYGPRGFR